jgi:hypothetical protein
VRAGSRPPIDPVRLALVVALALIVQSGEPNPTHLTFWLIYAYLGGIAPLICWRLDDWLGLASRPLRERLRERRGVSEAPEPAA